MKEVWQLSLCIRRFGVSALVVEKEDFQKKLILLVMTDISKPHRIEMRKLAVCVQQKTLVPNFLLLTK